MNVSESRQGVVRPVGLAHLHQKYSLRVPRPATTSYLAPGANRTERDGENLTQFFTASYDPGTEDREHLEFALKHERFDLRVIAAWCRTPTAAAQVITLVEEKPTGEYARRLWFLYEWLTGTRLPLADGAKRSYVELLDSTEYVVRRTAIRSRRHHVWNNLLGPPLLCPVVRRTPTIDALLATRLATEVNRLVPPADLQLLARAVSYLYLKETKSSFAIEGESLGPGRDERFVAQLREVSAAPRPSSELLIRWQQQLVDSRYAANTFRSDQVYVADAAPIGRQGRIHYVAPRPDDVERLMEAFFELDKTLDGAPPLVHAALLSFVFVFIHPFDDGNGRLHRLLIHNVLRRRGETPAEVILPVSAVIVNDRARYDEVLEQFSRPVMESLAGRYTRETDVVTVHEDTLDVYRSFDATSLVEALGSWVSKALTDELVPELSWLRRFDETRDAVRSTVDMPDKRLRLFIGLVEQNAGSLSAAKRGLFPELSDDEVSRMEEAVREHLLAPAESGP